MDYKIRTVKTSSGKQAIQIVRYIKGKRIILKHIGSGMLDKEILSLRRKAKDWIENDIYKKGLFTKSSLDKFEEQYKYLGFTYRYAYQFLEKIYLKFNFHKFLKELFKDLVLARILEPGSKKNNLEFLKEFLDKFHSENVLYKEIVKYDKQIKENLEKEIVAIAKTEFGFDFSFVLYDVTTLYFESFKEDEFKVAGFSKDNKPNQPQVVIGLIVTARGFPISYQIFKGNIFEGNTFLPIIKDFKKLHDIRTLTIVADSAMFSKINFESLEENNLNYIIGARLANLKQHALDHIEKEMRKINGFSIRLGNLIVDYSSARYVKDRKDLEKQIARAKKNVDLETFRTPRIKFLKTENLKISLNQTLIDKHARLCGLKGYNTNLNLPNKEVIKYYRNLYKVEHAWRIAKSDLEARPIYHHKEESIKNHVLICFGALVISSYLELKNKMSITKIVHLLKSMTEARILDLKSGQVIHNMKKITPEIQKLEDLTH